MSRSTAELSATLTVDSVAARLSKLDGRLRWYKVSIMESMCEGMQGEVDTRLVENCGYGGLAFAGSG